MSYLRFDKTLMTNLEESLQREILRVNNAGAYHLQRLLIVTRANITACW